MAYTDHSHVRTPREGDISTRLNDRRSDVAARLMRRAIRRARSPREMQKLEFEALAS